MLQEYDRKEALAQPLKTTRFRAFGVRLAQEVTIIQRRNALALLRLAASTLEKKSSVAFGTSFTRM